MVTVFYRSPDLNPTAHLSTDPVMAIQRQLLVSLMQTGRIFQEEWGKLPNLGAQSLERLTQEDSKLLVLQKRLLQSTKFFCRNFLLRHSSFCCCCCLQKIKKTAKTWIYKSPPYISAIHFHCLLNGVFVVCNIYTWVQHCLLEFGTCHRIMSVFHHPP